MTSMVISYGSLKHIKNELFEEVKYCFSSFLMNLIILDFEDFSMVNFPVSILILVLVYWLFIQN